MTPEQLADAKDRLIDRLEEFLGELLSMTAEEAQQAGVGIDLVDGSGGCLRDLSFDEQFRIDGMRDAIAELRHQEEIAGAIQAGKKVGS